MASMGLDHPSDIPWKRRCVSEGMVDADLCDAEAPPKWRSSLALFTHTPEDKYQIYDGREIVYLKVTATLTGYQPPGDEIEGEVDWDDFETEIEDKFEGLLESYRKCTGGLLQVTVGPDDEDDWSADSYPYIADYEPKRRALYTMATETNSRMSRSLEQLQVRKNSATTESNEVLDVDLGGSWSASGGVSASGGGGGGGVNVSASRENRQRVGSKELNQQNEQRIRSSSRSQERREAYSHTTRLTQLHHLLDSYHKGTNRALFFFLPRPYVAEEETGLVDGPRGIDGVQEVFLVVNKPAEMGELTVSTRLDTSHYGKSKSYTYKTTDAAVSGREIDLAPPSANSPDARKTGTKSIDIGIQGGGASVQTGDAYYDCYQRTESETRHWRPENHGFSEYTFDKRTQGGFEIIDSETRGPDASVDVSLGNGGDFLRIETEATSRACHYDRTEARNTNIEIPDAWVNADDTIDREPGYAAVDVRVYLRTTEESKLDEVTKELLITTRGLCCGSDEDLAVVDEAPVDRVEVEEDLEQYRRREQFDIDLDEDDEETTTDSPTAETVGTAGSDTARTVYALASDDGTPGDLMTIQEANYIGTDVTRRALGQSAGSRRRQTPRSTLEADYTVDALASRVAATPESRKRLQEPAASVDSVLTRELAEALDLETVTRRNVVESDTDELVELTGLDRGTVNRGKLAMLGVPLRDTRCEAARERGDRDGPVQADVGDDDEDSPFLSLAFRADLDGDDDPDIDIEASVDFDDEDDEPAA